MIALNSSSQVIKTDTIYSAALSEVTVSASRTQSGTSDLPQSVSIITSAEIIVSPYNNVEDIIRNIPGLYNFRHSSLHTNGIISPIEMRGVGKNRVLILIDGVPQNTNFNNSIAWVAWGHIPKEAIERIEVIRGAASALYGSEGLGGIINIITKKPTEGRNTSLTAKAGNASTLFGNGFYSQNLKNLSFMVTGGYEKSDGFYMLEIPEEYNTLRDREKGQLFGKLIYDFNEKSKLGLSALYFNQDAGQGRTFFHQDLQLDQYTLDYSHLFNGFKLESIAFFNRANKTAYQDNASDNFTSLFRKENFRNIYHTGIDIQGSLLKWQNFKIVMGGAYSQAYLNYNEDYSDIERDGGAKGKQQIYSPFLLIDLKLLNDKIFANLAIRYDNIQTSEGRNWDTQASAGKPPYNNEYDRVKRESFSPKMGISWRPAPRTTLRTSIGKGFRAPSLFELYKVHVRQGGTFYREANPALYPEQIVSWDIGAEHTFMADVFLGVTYYQSAAKNYIGDRLINTASFSQGTRTRYEYLLDNISEVKIHGIEMETRWRPVEYLTVKGNYTYNISRIEKDDQDQSLRGNYLPNNPRHKIHLGLNYSNPEIINVFLGVNAFAKIFFDNENTLEKDRYHTLDMSFSRTYTDKFTVFVNAENILNNKYPIFLSPSAGNTIAPGTIVMGGIKYEF